MGVGTFLGGVAQGVATGSSIKNQQATLDMQKAKLADEDALRKASQAVIQKWDAYLSGEAQPAPAAGPVQAPAQPTLSMAPKKPVMLAQPVEGY